MHSARGKSIIRKMFKSKFFIIGSILALFIVLLALAAPAIVSYDAEATSLSSRLLQPEFFSKGWTGHILGTDSLGRDILTRLLIGSRISLIIALVGVVIPSIIGTALGMISGYSGGMIDSILMRLNDIQLSIPLMVFAITVMAIFGNSIQNLLIVLVIVGWVNYTRVMRECVMGIRDTEFIKASRVLGGSNLHIIFTQILPNIVPPLIILMSQQVGMVILTEANLSFLGLGVPLPQPSWGSMIADGREYIASAPWTVIAPGMALMTTVLAFNFLGDGIRDVLDPKNID